MLHETSVSSYEFCPRMVLKWLVWIFVKKYIVNFGLEHNLFSQIFLEP